MKETLLTLFIIQIDLLVIIVKLKKSKKKGFGCYDGGENEESLCFSTDVGYTRDNPLDGSSLK